MCVWILLLVGLFIIFVFVVLFVLDLVYMFVYFGVLYFDCSMMCGCFDKIDGVINFDEVINQGGIDFIVDVVFVNMCLWVLDGVLKLEQFFDVV